MQPRRHLGFFTWHERCVPMTNTVARKQPKESRLDGFVKEVKKNWMLLVMLLPATTFVVIFNYIPMTGVVNAFKNFRMDMGIWRSPWVGFANFEFFFRSGDALRLTTMTVGYNIAFLVTGLFWSVLLAVVLSELKGKLFKRVTHSLIFLPHFISWVVIAFMAFNLFNLRFGVINSILGDLGRDPIHFYGSPTLWRYLIVVFSNWRGVGFGSIIYLAVLTGISPEYYEAAQVDGATVWQRIRYISIPFLMPTIGILLLLSLGGVFRGGGDMFYQLIGNNFMLAQHVDVIDAYLLRMLINPLSVVNFSMLTAVGLYQQFAGFVLIMTVNGIVRKVNKDGALF